MCLYRQLYVSLMLLLLLLLLLLQSSPLTGSLTDWLMRFR